MKEIKEEFETLKKKNFIKGEYSNLESYFKLKEDIEKEKNASSLFSSKMNDNIIKIKNEYFPEYGHTIRWWIKNYLLAKEFYKKNGHLLPYIGETYSIYNYKIRIDDWVMRQRYLYKTNKLRENQIKLLDEIGMVWYIKKRNYKDQEEIDETKVKSA